MLLLGRFVDYSELKVAARANKNHYICESCEVSWAGKPKCWVCEADCSKTKRKFVSSLHHDLFKIKHDLPD